MGLLTLVILVSLLPLGIILSLCVKDDSFRAKYKVTTKILDKFFAVLNYGHFILSLLLIVGLVFLLFFKVFGFLKN
jgi:hypothetical protein